MICRDHCSGEGCLVHVTGATTVREGRILLSAGTTAVYRARGGYLVFYASGTTTVEGRRDLDINRGHSSGEGCLVIRYRDTNYNSLYSVISVLHRGHQRGRDLYYRYC